ncbi:MAG: AlpA family transcriptional regulator [Methylococcales bacterium]|nr:AlpA family transcriptional regulator [Methylococcales bacterium]
MLIKLNEVKAKTGLSRSSIYAYIDKGIFPAQVKLGERCVAWVDIEIESWVQGKINARDAVNDEDFINKTGEKK